MNFSVAGFGVSSVWMNIAVLPARSRRAAALERF